MYAARCSPFSSRYLRKEGVSFQGLSWALGSPHHLRDIRFPHQVATNCRPCIVCYPPPADSLGYSWLSEHALVRSNVFLPRRPTLGLFLPLLLARIAGSSGVAG
jgi:hypothetical protein